MTFKNDLQRDILDAALDAHKNRPHFGEGYNPGNCKHCQNLDLEPHQTEEHWEEKTRLERQAYERNASPDSYEEQFGLEE